MRCVHLFHGRWTRLSVLSVAAGALATVASMAAPSFAGTITFGSGGNTFAMEFVTIGNPGNAADTDPSARPVSTTLGRVDRTYDIGKFEVSRAMVDAYNLNSGVVAITLSDMTSSGGNGANRPATGITWNEAARFVNWLNTSTGGVVAYNYADGNIATALTPWTSADTLDYDPSNPYRSIRAKYVLPSYNEWYKAAYYDPNKTGGAGYWDYATGSDSAPTAVTGGTTAGTAVYGQTSAQGPADVTDAGGLSPYFVMGLNGNAREWEESSFDVTLVNYNTSGSSSRGRRGGGWDSSSSGLSLRTESPHDAVNNSAGFRVAVLSSDAVVPEPSMMVIGTLFGIGGLMANRRLKK